MSDDTNVMFITGGASGIGKATALAFAGKDTAITIADMNEEGGEETAHAVVAAGGKALFIRTDVSKKEDVDAAVRLTVDTFGDMQYALNSAGIGHSGKAGARKLADADDEAWHRIMAINTTGVYYSMKAELKHMMQAGGGAIVNMSSVAGLLGATHASAYSASKHAVIGLTKTAAVEYARANIRINAVCPAYTQTPMVDAIKEASPVMYERMPMGIPMKRIGEVDEVVSAIMWLFSDGASFVTGQSIAIDGGLTAQ